MGRVKSPLDDLIRPLTFATGDGVPLERIGGLDALVRRKVADWRNVLPVGAKGHQQAAQWLALLDGYEAMDLDGRRECLRQLLAGVSTEATAAPTPKAARTPAGVKVAA